MKRSDVLYTADSLINGDRQNDYGEAHESFEAIASAWSSYLKADVAPHDVAMMMVMLKAIRFSNSPDNPDHAVDICGYAALASEIASDS